MNFSHANLCLRPKVCRCWKGMVISMEKQNFLLPAEVLETNLKAAQAKVKYPLGKLLLLGMMAGIFVGFGAAASSTAMHGIADVGIARLVAGCIFPVGLMMIIFVGGELITSNCLMISGVIDKRYSVMAMLKTLAVLYLSNLIGSVIVAVLVYYSGIFNYTGGELGAFVINVAYAKANVAPGAAICSGILCNILVCVASLMATAAKDIAGKTWAIFFPIFAFVICGFEHCVANMYYLIAGMLAVGNADYVAKAEARYGLLAGQLKDSLNMGGFLSNQIPVTIGNILGGMVFVALPLYAIHKSRALNHHNNIEAKVHAASETHCSICDFYEAVSRAEREDA